MVTRVMISFPDDFLKEVDRVAREEHRSRSELLREAIRLYIAMRQVRPRPGDLPHVQQAVKAQDRLAQIAPGKGEDSANEVRYWRGVLNRPDQE